MSNYKVKVNNEAESKEVQELFFELDYKWIGLGGFYHKISSNFNYITAYHEGKTLAQGHGLDAEKELTIPQLKDLVVLKRNSIDDATHINTVTGSKVLQQGDKNYYWQLGEWHLYPCGVDIEPIEASPKEYLVPQGNGKYALTKATEKRVSDWVEVPDGAVFYAEDSNMGVKDKYFFRLKDENFDDEAMWISNQWMRACFNVRNMNVLWQRHTQPEELPFVDDKPKSLNTTYTEIEQVRQTLNERQSTYGDFTSVANTTGQLMAVILNSKNGQTLPYAHEEALHMICSKIARIMNGDINHKDSWHDIAGYATLIDESL